MTAPAPDRLPASLLDVAEALGLALAVKLIQHFGGVEMRIPNELGDGHQLAVLGEEDARRLCGFMGGSFLYVPHGRPRKNARDDVLALEAAGRTRAQVARQLGLSQRHVRRLANSAGTADPNQGDLFD